MRSVLRTTLLGMVLLGMTCLQQEGSAMVFRPKVGAMWDPSVLWHDGKYYAFMMYNRDGNNGLAAGHCLLATSSDGVHWEDQGPIIDERGRPDGSTFFKCFVRKCGDKFVMDHGVALSRGQDLMRFYQSKDLRHWDYITSTEPDDRWYTRERWDHMYMLPKEEGKPEAGFWGYIVAVAKEQNSLPAMMESRDGTKWEALPPARTEWGTTPPIKYLEYGGCERIGGKYYLIGGTGGYMGPNSYAMFTFVADNPRGPFRPDAEAFRLCGNQGKYVTWLACWARGKNELLISNYASMQSDDRAPWMLPLRKPVVGKDGHLRLGWWKGNEALKGDRLEAGKKKVVLNGDGKPGNYDVMYLDELGNGATGVILEGKLKARASAKGDKGAVKPVVGFVIEEKTGQATAVQMGIGKPEGRETHIGRLVTGPGGTNTFTSEDVTGKGCATVTGVEDGREHTFRLLCRMEMFELYIDDLLMQTCTRQPGSGKVGFLVCNARAEFSNLRAWTMDARQTALRRDSAEGLCDALDRSVCALPPRDELRSRLPSDVTRDRASSMAAAMLSRQKELPAVCRLAVKQLARLPESPTTARIREMLKRIDELGLAGAAYAKALAGTLNAWLKSPSIAIVVSKFKASKLQSPVADIAAAQSPQPGLARKTVPYMPEHELADIRAFHGGADGVVYLEAAVKLDQTYRGALAYGADGPVRVWVNGRAVDCQPKATNPARVGSYVTPVSWKKGANRIVFALATNHGNAWGVQARVMRSLGPSC